MIDVSFFAAGLAALSVLTGLFTEAMKKLLENYVYSANILAAFMAVLVGVAYCIGYAVFKEVVVDSNYILSSIGLIACSWVGSMIGYDKIMQLFDQVRW